MEDKLYETIEWHKVKIRFPTQEEIEDWAEEYGEPAPSYFFNCKMPDNGSDILIVTSFGVDKDVCCFDEGYYLETRGDWDDVIAWAYMPKYDVRGGEQ